MRRRDLLISALAAATGKRALRAQPSPDPKKTHLNIMVATLNTGDRQNFANNAYPTNWTPDLQNIYKADQDTCIQVQTYFKNNADSSGKGIRALLEFLSGLWKL